MSLSPSPPTILSWRLINFYVHSPPSADSGRAVVSYWRKYVHNCFGGTSLTRNSVSRLKDRLDMTLIVLTELKNLEQSKINNRMSQFMGKKSFPEKKDGEKKKSKNPNIMKPGTKPKANIKSMFMAQAAATTKRKPEVSSRTDKEGG